MKTLKTFVVAAAAVTLLAGVASAQTVLRLTGSSAYRASVHTAIAKLFGGTGSGPGFTLTTGVYGYKGSSFLGASQAVFVGTIGGESVVIKTFWSGSARGIQTVTQNIAETFIPNSGHTPALTSTGVVVTSASAAEIPDVAMSDVYQSSTPFASPLLTDYQFSGAPSVGVGVVPFRWVASKSAPTGLNLTTQLAQALFENGTISYALFTGVPADAATTVFATGRDPDSGTRLSAFAESGLGAAATVVQYQPTISAGAVTSHQIWPQSTVNGITFEPGNGGYASGGTLATDLTATTTAIGGFYISYLGTGDADAKIASGDIKEVTYNGFKLETSAPYTSVLEGRYTFWAYEHMLYRSTLPDVVGDKRKTIANTIAAQIYNTDAVIKLPSMRVSRGTDGGLIGQDY